MLRASEEAKALVEERLGFPLVKSSIEESLSRVLDGDNSSYNHYIDPLM